MDTLRKAVKKPVVVVFFVFLFLYSAIDLIQPDRAFSTLENRNLTQMPAFNMSDFLENRWTYQFGEYTRDQFMLRDEWVSAHSVLEVAQGKLESGGVWYAQDGYQIAKNSTWSDAQEMRLPANTETVAALAQRWPGQVSALIVPSPANILSDKLRYNPPQIDENARLDEMFSQMRAAGVQTIDLRDAFSRMEATGQQIYYRTDHHWTTDGGAYTAYEAFCAAVGRTPAAPGAARVEVPGFLGTNYARTLRYGTTPDTLVYYDIQNPMAIHTIQADGSISEEATTIMLYDQLSQFDKYAAFLHGNKGYCVIQGNGEGSVLVIKDSYANSFVPYLVENYATVGIIDLRNWFSVDDIIREEGYEDILVLYSFASFSEDIYVSRMSAERQTSAG